jgi:hypothetical protein
MARPVSLELVVGFRVRLNLFERFEPHRAESGQPAPE